MTCEGAFAMTLAESDANTTTLPNLGGVVVFMNCVGEPSRDSPGVALKK